MSKSVSGQDVEDMLSSVRRLVSSELPRNRRTNLPEGPGALVLTEAQRIEPSMIGHNSQRKSLEDRIAELEVAVSESADDWEPDGSEDQDQHRPDRIVYKPSEDESQGDQRRTLRLSEIALIETGPANDDAAKVPDAETASATFRHGADDGNMPPIEASEPSESDALQADDADLPDLAEAPRDEARSDEPEPEVVAEVEAGAKVEEETTHDEAAVPSPKETDAETEEEPVDDIATDEAFEEALAEAVAASLPDAVADEVEERDEGIATERVKELYGEPGDAQVDEASLHPLVASLIREELQGELGERITRNVRKLVRQEIQRALTVRELE